MRITDKLKEQILSLRKSGWSYNKISLKLQVSLQQVMYHANPSYRDRFKFRARGYNKNYFHKNKVKLMDKRKDYMRKYKNKLYHTDEEFRKKQIQASIKSKKKRKQNE